MDTKAKGDIAEQAATLQALRMGWGVLQPVGDRLSYDLVFDVSGKLVKVQVKAAWLDKKSRNLVVDNRRTKTNRRRIKRVTYTSIDFDFALLYVDFLNTFWVVPVDEFVSFGSNIHLIVFPAREFRSKMKKYRGAWNLIQSWATPGVILDVKSVKVGETCDVVIPSQASENEEGVETGRQTPERDEGTVQTTEGRKP